MESQTCSRTIASVICIFLTTQSVQGESVNVKVDNLVKSSNCTSSIGVLRNFLTRSSESIAEATDRHASIDKIIVQIPTHWAACGTAINGRDRIPDEAVDVHIKPGSNPPKSVQKEGCRIQGERVDISWNFVELLTVKVNQFVAEWIKMRYGIFDEHGYENNTMYPLYYRTENNSVYPTSCTDGIITGNFSTSCLSDPSACSIDKDQTGIKRSLLYSTDEQYFPQMTRICNNDTHKLEAPTRHNLLCGGQSAMEIIAAGRRVKDLRAPNISFIQDKAPAELIVIVDVGNDMMINSRWDRFRLGVEQMFLALNNDTILTVIQNNLIHAKANHTAVGGMFESEWKFYVFPEIQPTGGRLSLFRSFQLVKQQLNYFEKPDIIIITATGTHPEDNDLTEAVDLIRQHRLRVDILTFVGVDNPSLLDLTLYGSVFAVHNTGELESSFYIGSVLTSAAWTAQNQVRQYVVAELVERPTQSGFINGTFRLPNGTTSSANPQMSIVLLLTSGTATNGYIKVWDPNGKVYTQSDKIPTKWTTKVRHVLASYVPDEWSFKVTVDQPQLDDKMYVIVSVNVAENVYGQGLLEEAARKPVNASEIFALKVFAHIDNLPLTEDTSLTVHIGNPVIDEDEQTISLKDDGLTIPDIKHLDGVYSQYVFKLFSSGFYSTLYKLQGPDLSRTWPGRAFYISEAMDPNGPDRIPPGRIADLHVELHPVMSDMIQLTWTAPGGDLNEGEVDHYTLECGYSRTSISYDSCNDIRRTAFFARNPAGTTVTESRKFTTASRGRLIFFRLYGTDFNGNDGPYSNVASILIPGEVSTTSTTTALSTYTSASTISTEAPGFTLSKTAFIAIVSTLSGLLLIIVILILVYCILLQRKKRKDNEVYRKVVRRQTLTKSSDPMSLNEMRTNPYNSPTAHRHSVRTRPVPAARRSIGSRMKTNGSLKSDQGTGHRYYNDDDSFSDTSTSDEFEHRVVYPQRPIGQRNRAYSPPAEERARYSRNGRAEVVELNVDDLREIPVYERPRSRRPIVVAGGGQLHSRESSEVSTSTANTFQRIDDAPEMHPYPQSDPRLPQPFNYIAHSQRLYGDHHNPPSEGTRSHKSKAISFV